MSDVFQDLLAPGEQVDLTNCDREPIHVPGSIQPHGVMLVMDAAHRIVQVSANVPNHLGLEAKQLLGSFLTDLIDPDQLQTLQEALERDDLDTNPLFVFPLQLQNGTLFDAVVHRLDPWVVLELEPAPPSSKWTDRYRQMSSVMNRVNQASSLQEACERLAREVHQLTAYDRVMVYQFAQDGTGTVIAEERADHLESFLGLRYPASDIPKQARALYVKNHIRVIGSSDYTPVPMLSFGEGPDPLDMSYSFLRSVSPIHLEYLRNMGVGASMSVSILKDGELWGLIACHHDTPKVLSYSLRAMCEFLGQMLSLQISSKVDREDSFYARTIQASAARMVEHLASTSEIEHAFHQMAPDLFAMVRSDGLAVISGTEVTTLGITPSKDQMDLLLPWITEQGRVYATDALQEVFPEAQGFPVAGVLALTLSRSHPEVILWFRQEVTQQVTWGGNPHKAVRETDGGVRLSPRKSFEAWKETVHGHSEPWHDLEVSALRDLHKSSLDVVLRRTEELQQLNQQLERSNTELDAFAYVASHDLKEPLRGLHNYAVMLSEDYTEQLEEDARHKLSTMIRLTQRLESLIDSLLSYSRVGRVDLAVRDTSLQDVVEDVLDLLKPFLEQRQVQVLMPRTFPTVRCDAIRLGEVFNNLITNGVKYNLSDPPTIELGYLLPAEGLPPSSPQNAQEQMIYYVRDNGIGIPEQHHQTIFRFFKRLHTRDEYGGGTGAGLSIAQKIVERHGGTLWLESEPGTGTTFYFTLPQQA